MLQLQDFHDSRVGSPRLRFDRLKGSDGGDFRLTDVELASLRAWVRVRGNEPGPLFPSQWKRPISRFRLDQLMKKYCALAGIAPEKAHCHTLKHSCGTDLLTEGMPIEDVQDHLGHRNIANTMIYAKITNKRREDRAERMWGWR